MGVRALPELGNDVRVEKEAQRRTRRARRGFLRKSASDPTLGKFNSHSLRLSRRRIGRNAALKISRCSASMDLPVLAARALTNLGYDYGGRMMAAWLDR
jgi:hypothetical protein